MADIVGWVDDLDIKMDKIHRLITAAARNDPELGAGLGTTESLGSVQRKIDRAAAACETLDGHIRDVMARRRR